MENQEYLNQIAAKSAPVKPSSGKSSKFDIKAILHSKIFLFSAIAVVAFILLAIIGSALGGNKKDLKSEIIKFRLHVNGTSELIEEYQPKVRSSNLRSYSASLQTLLSKVNSDVSGYLTNKYGYKENKDDKKLRPETDKQKEALNQELFEAKINGNLDRVYAHKMAYEITKFINEEVALQKATKDDTLIAILDQSKTSLETLYDSFNDFSESKQ